MQRRLYWLSCVYLPFVASPMYIGKDYIYMCIPAHAYPPKHMHTTLFLPPPPPLAHARPCLSTGWALNRCFEEILGPQFLWSRMEDWVFVERLYRERGALSCL